MNVGRFFRDVGDAYDRRIVDADKQPQLLILVAFLLTFIIVRIITHAIRAGRWRKVLRNVQTSGTHIHHLVPGILLLVIAGYLGNGLPPHQPREWTAILFGIGAALTLDEFALWLHLEDVYWAKEGRQSVDAIVVAATVSGVLILGGWFWVDIGHAIGRLVTG